MNVGPLVSSWQGHSSNTHFSHQTNLLMWWDTPEQADAESDKTEACTCQVLHWVWSWSTSSSYLSTLFIALSPVSMSKLKFLQDIDYSLPVSYSICKLDWQIEALHLGSSPPRLSMGLTEGPECKVWASSQQCLLLSLNYWEIQALNKGISIQYLKLGGLNQASAFY